MVFPSDNLKNRKDDSLCTIRNSFQNNVPNYILKILILAQNVIGIVLNKDNMGVSDMNLKLIFISH